MHSELLEIDASAKRLLSKCVQTIHETAEALNSCFLGKSTSEEVLTVLEKSRQKNETMLIIMQRFMTTHLMNTPTASHYSSFISSGSFCEETRSEGTFFNENKESFQELIGKLHETIKMIERSKRKIHLRQTARPERKKQRKTLLVNQFEKENGIIEAEMQNFRLAPKETKKPLEKPSHRNYHYSSFRRDRLEKRSERISQFERSYSPVSLLKRFFTKLCSS